jgi:hypothetical protein
VREGKAHPGRARGGPSRPGHHRARVGARGLTSEWAWSTPAKFYAADLADGFATGPGAPRTGPRPPSWNACLRPRNRRTGSFIEEDPLRISDLGREHYETH